MGKRMDETELSALIDNEIRTAQGYYGGKLAEQRRRASYYYLAEPIEELAPPEVEGRSKVVYPFIRNTEEAMLPQLMEKFTGGEHVVEFEPQLPGEDEQRAKNATEYLNYLFWKKNSGHRIAETWMRDALRHKNGIVKVWWDTRVEETKEEYKGLSQVELAEIMDDPEVEVTEQKAYPDPDDVKQRKEATEQIQQQLAQLTQQAHQLAGQIQPTGQPNPQAQQMMQQKQGLEGQLQQIAKTPPVLSYDITAQRSKKGGKLSIENVPPEEFLISRKAKSIATASFCGQRTPITLSDLKSMGYKNLDDLGSDESEQTMNSERIERDSYDDDLAAVDSDNLAGDESQKRYWVNECYVRVDWDGDGISELRKVTKVGGKVIDNEEVDVAPFADIVCIRQPHKFYGLSLWDLGRDTQLTMTSLLRSRLDNEYLETNGRYFAVNNEVNLDDLLTSRPGGVVRVKNRDSVGRLDQGRGDTGAGMDMLQFMEGFGESATGWTRSSQGNSSAPLMGASATAANIVANRDDMRIDLIARNFAEGFVELFRQMLKLVSQHQDKKTELRLAGKWVDIDPREWRNQFDVNINVGLGAGTRDQKMQRIQAVIGQQEKVYALGVATPENIYAASAEMTRLTGQKNADAYFTDPTKQPPQPPKPDPEMVKGQVQSQLEQIKGQVAAQLAQTKAQTAIQVAQTTAQTTMQVEQFKAQMKQETDYAEQQAQAQQTTLQQENDAQLSREKAALESQTKQQEGERQERLEAMRLSYEDKWKERDLEVRLAIAQISATKGADASTGQAADAAAGKLDAMMGAIERMTKAITAPKQVIRDASGKVTGIQHASQTQ